MVVIIGGGITGLSAAYELSTRRVPFVLLEASDRAGGLVRTEHAGGYTIDAGADSMLAAKPAAINLCQELGLGDRLIGSTPPRTAYVHARGRLHALPSPSVFGIPTTLSGVARYGLLPPPARIRLALNMRRATGAKAIDGAASGGGDESVADFYRRHFGPATVSLIAEPLLGGIHAGDVERLSIAAVAPRLVAAARTGRLFHAPSSRSSSARSATPGEGMFKALRGGMGELVSAIESRLTPGSVRLRSAARSASRLDGRWRVVTEAGTIDARAVILSAPAYVAADVLAEADPVLSDLCAEVPYVSTVSVALGWPRASILHPLAGSGFVVARRHSRLRITACTWVTSKWQDRAGPGMVLLRAFLGGASDTEAAHLSDDAIREIALRDLRDVLGASGLPDLVQIHRWPRAGAQHHVGHAARTARIDARLASLPGLMLAGSGFRAIGVPDCVADGRAAAVQASNYVALESKQG